jgi:hypothetical protein
MNSFFIALCIVILLVVLCRRRFFSGNSSSRVHDFNIPSFDPQTLKGPWRSEFAVVNGIKLHYVIGGESNNKLILFLHGNHTQAKRETKSKWALITKACVSLMHFINCRIS